MVDTRFITPVPWVGLQRSVTSTLFIFEILDRSFRVISVIMIFSAMFFWLVRVEMSVAVLTVPFIG